MNYLKKFARLIYFFKPSGRDYALSQFKSVSFLFYFLLLFLKSKRNNYPEKKSVLININNALPDRYLFALLLFFQINNYQIYLKPNFRFLSKIPQTLYLNNAIKKEKLKIALSYRLKKEPNLEIIENCHSSKIAKKHKIAIISYDNPFETIDLQMPFSLHPVAYDKIESHKELKNKLIKMRESSKKVKILFAGNFNHPLYEELNSYFPQFLDRNKILHYILSKCPDVVINNISTLEEKSEFTNNFLILHRKDVNFYPKDWLTALKKSVFFLCPPGYLMPFSHNLIEAMACGVIPILEYGNLLNPPLEHGVNCIAFKGKDNLIDEINNILQMPEEKISEIRKNVIDYYEKYLSPESFIKQVESIEKKQFSIKIIGGRFSFNRTPINSIR